MNQPIHDGLDLDEIAAIPDPYAGGDRGGTPSVPALGGSRAPSRSQRRRRLGLALAAALLYEAAWVLFAEHRADLASVAPSTIALGLLVPLGACALALSAVLRSGPRGLGAPAPYLVACACLPPVLFAGGASLWTSPDPPDSAFSFWAHAARCMLVTALLAAAPLALGVLAFRRAFVAAAGWRTASLGAACGALAASTMSLVCSNGGVLHVVIGHGAMILAGAGAGALVGRSLTRA